MFQVLVGLSFILAILSIYMFAAAAYYKHKSERDGLTGAYNKSWFMGENSSKLVRRMQAVNKEKSYPFGLIMIDMDNFKQVNDSRGHLYGDLLIKQTADAIRLAVGDGIVARIGGDEFAVIVNNMGSSEMVSKIILRIEQNVLYFTAGSVSAGGVRYAKNMPVSVEALMGVADKSMYERKRAKKGKI
jgi:diguanylate cyclase (GGDEF)-like protein